MISRPSLFAASRILLIIRSSVNNFVAHPPHQLRNIDATATNDGVVSFTAVADARSDAMATAERVAVVRERDGHWSARTISIFAALLVDAGLVWLLYFRASYNPPRRRSRDVLGPRRSRICYLGILQQWTLASQTGRDDDFSAALDKFI